MLVSGISRVLKECRDVVCMLRGESVKLKKVVATGIKHSTSNFLVEQSEPKMLGSFA